jgi:hypothetical protein
MHLGEMTLRTVLSPPKGFKRDTLHAWGEEWFIFPRVEDPFITDEIKLQPYDTEEVVDTAWMNLELIKHRPEFMNTHHKMILGHEAYLAYLETSRK